MENPIKRIVFFSGEIILSETTEIKDSNRRIKTTQYFSEFISNCASNISVNQISANPTKHAVTKASSDKITPANIANDSTYWKYLN